MKLQTFFAIISATILLSIAVMNNMDIIKGHVKPTLITWVLWVIAVTLSLGTYKSSKKHNLWDNIINTIDLVFVWSITIVTIFFSNNPNKFDIHVFDIVCIFLSIIVLVFWRITKSHEKANIALQVIMVIAYFPTFYNLLHATESSESLFFWMFNWCAGLFGFMTAVMAKNKLAIIYSTRSILMLTIMIILILRLV